MRLCFVSSANVGRRIGNGRAAMGATRMSSSSASVAGIPGVVVKLFPSQGYAIIEDALQREYFFRFDENAPAVINSAPEESLIHPRKTFSTSWKVGMHVFFTPRERANQPYDRRFVAEQVRHNTTLSQTNIVNEAIARMEDVRWRHVLADAAVDDGGGASPSSISSANAPRYESSVTNFPPGYDIRYLVFEQDLKTPVMGTKKRHPLEEQSRDEHDASAGDEEFLLTMNAMERARREAEEVDLLSMSPYYR